MVGKAIDNVNGRITALNGKFKVVAGKEDATNRFGLNIPYETPLNFSAGYSGSKIHQLRAEFKNGKTND